jgi:hypothetical protein
MPLIGSIEPPDERASINEIRDYHNLHASRDQRDRKTYL